MYRLLVELLDPFVLAILLLGLCLVLLWRKRQGSGFRLWSATAAYAMLVLVCLPPAAHLALGSLEWAYPPRYDLPDDTQALVLLSGTVRPADAVQPRPSLSHETVIRCLKAVELYRDAGPRLVVVSGGNPDPRQKGPTCARAMADFLVQYGVQPDDIVTEERSRTTYENAVYTSRLLAARGLQRIVLVTSATHLRRAVGCFRAQGLDVTARGCAHQATEYQWSATELLPSPQAAVKMHAVFHEWLGIAWYRLRGRM